MTIGNWVTIGVVVLSYIALIYTNRSEIAVLKAQIRYLTEEVNELRKMFYQFITRDVDRRISSDP